ncbi:MAG: hypothetical protein HC779_02195 [Phyllobacteriaceae bacterium]|nr:hypothetical protein [Phyllobacteriaceae bacterium]
MQAVAIMALGCSSANASSVIVLGENSGPNTGSSRGSIEAKGSEEADSSAFKRNEAQTIAFSVNAISLKDLLPALSAVSGLQFAADGSLDYRLDAFSYEGPPSAVAAAIARTLPVGYFNDSGAIAFYRLDRLTTKTFSPQQYNIAQIRSRYAIFADNARPPLSASVLPGGIVRLEGPSSLFAAIERDATAPAGPAPKGALTLIRGGVAMQD